MKQEILNMINELSEERNITVEEFINSLPDNYFGLIDKRQVQLHYHILSELREKANRRKIYRYKGDFEEYVIHNFNSNKLRKNLHELFAKFGYNSALCRIFTSLKSNFMITVFYPDGLSEERKNSIPEHRTVFLEDKRPFFFNEMGKCIKHMWFDHSIENNRSRLKIEFVNSSRTTAVNNIVDTFQHHNVYPKFIEIWRLRTAEKQLSSLFHIDCTFASIIREKDVMSMSNDLDRYTKTYIKPMSVFDIVGPSMVGPSSSHTAGACRIGNISRNIILARLKAYPENRVRLITIKLFGSFRDTGLGHKTPQALAGGIMGFAPDDSRIMSYGDPEYLFKNGFSFDNDCNAEFAGFIRSTEADEKKYRYENNSNIAEIIVETTGDSYTITGFSIGGGNVEIRYINERLENPINGKSDSYLDGFSVLPISLGNRLPLIEKVDKDCNDSASFVFMFYNSFEELVEFLKDSKKTFLDAAIDTEVRLQRTTREAIYSKMSKSWDIMKTSIRQGLNDKNLTMLKLTGHDSAKIQKFVSSSLIFDNVFGKAITYSTAINELNAKSGLIIACPTAGSCGILPGTLKAFQEVSDCSDQQIIEALIISGFMGMILFSDVTTAGADYGCQAEIGSAAAMTASALAYLLGGNCDKIISAFTLAIKNCLGLICDPIAGLVEVPCVKRNGIYSSVALSAAIMAMSGVRSFVSADEVVLTMREVGEKLNKDYKETAGGGLAQTRDGKTVERAFESENSRFFDCPGCKKNVVKTNEHVDFVLE